MASTKRKYTKLKPSVHLCGKFFSPLNLLKTNTHSQLRGEESLLQKKKDREKFVHWHIQTRETETEKFTFPVCNPPKSP